MNVDSWFEGTVALDKLQDDGCTKAVTMKFLVNVPSFKEVEDLLIKEVAPFTSGNLEVKAVKKVRISDIYPSDADNATIWYRVKVMLTVIDEKTMAEKDTPFIIMVQAAGFDDAVERLKEGMSGSLADWRVSELKETSIEDVYC